MLMTRLRTSIISASRRGCSHAGKLLCFVHADSRPPREVVRVVRETMGEPGTVLGGFRTVIEGTGGRPLRFMTTHHFAKTFYLPLLARPLSFFRCAHRRASQS